MICSSNSYVSSFKLEKRVTDRLVDIFFVFIFFRVPKLGGIYTHPSLSINSTSSTVSHEEKYAEEEKSQVNEERLVKDERRVKVFVGTWNMV